MSVAIAKNIRSRKHPRTVIIQTAFIGAALLFVFVFLVVPVILVFTQAFEKGWSAYTAAIKDADTLSAIRLTLLAAGIAVLLNTIFGIAASWALAKFRFPGKNILLSLLDLPFLVSPVISGMVFILLFGAHGWFGPVLSALGIKIVFAVPGIILATTFVTFPFVVKELLPVMQALGSDAEEAAMVLGASGWQMFFRVTLPSIKWGLLYGVVLCGARAMGEFGAVSVVSGHIRGFTNTIPLHVEILYNEYDFSGAFAVASLLMIVAVISIVLKSLIEMKTGHRTVPQPLTNNRGEQKL